MFYKVVQYTYIKDVPFTLHHLTKTKAKELLLLRLHTGLQESDLKKNVDSQFYLQGNWWKAYMKIENAGLLFSNQNFLQYYCKFYPLWSNQLVVDRYLQGVDYYSLSPHHLIWAFVKIAIFKQS